MLFAKHGTSEAYTDGRVLRVKAEGSFNEQGARLYCEGIRREAQALDGKPFVVLIDLTAVEGATPSGWALAERHNEWLASTSMVAKAVAAKGALVKNLTHKVNVSGGDDRVRVFDNMADAEAWVLDKLNAVQHPQSP